ncbi:hypothetical protein DPMN_069308 [Dreissena polymorpha]|uniref:C2H2-type domain-containing protein n=1 Tax=Dreissena polymorpha TaxID=45954 RepID=A0A9D3YZ86_DREPO|nr:hypothetical protein DPMN_069308 [Dreissena polymorpha]
MLEKASNRQQCILSSRYWACTNCTLSPIPLGYRYTCQYCGRGFKIHNDLVRHTLIHTGEKPFTCDVCGKKFNRKSNLKTHSLVHLKL